ncbi:MAG: fasciclin domain-containing protein, partial [Gemmatimonadaceae bacterium]
MKLASKAVLSLAAVAALVFTSSAQAQKMTAPHTEKTIVDVAVENGSFKTLVAALQAADLVGALQGKGPFT